MKKIIIIIAALFVALSITACQSLDVVGTGAITSFTEVAKNLSEPISSDPVNNGWSLAAPGGERFVWSKDFSAKGMSDLMMEFDIQPFLAAGLQPEKLDKNIYLYDKLANKLMVHAELGDTQFKSASSTDPLATFKEIVTAYRTSVNYHEKLDHYNIAFGGGNMFEWAKNLTTNDKDIVFVLNPATLISAGVDPLKVEGWVFAKVEIKNAQGDKELVDKLLKPYNLQ
ncbi:MAG: hypothetical protein WCI30_06150 [Clostridia bacterium]